MVRVFTGVERKRESLPSREAPGEYTQLLHALHTDLKTKRMVKHQTGYGHGSCNLARFGDDAVLEGDCLTI